MRCKSHATEYKQATHPNFRKGKKAETKPVYKTASRYGEFLAQTPKKGIRNFDIPLYRSKPGKASQTSAEDFADQLPAGGVNANRGTSSREFFERASAPWWRECKPKDVF
jgi:hypothetical protein